MSIQATVKQLSSQWHSNAGVDSVQEFNSIESSLGMALPADYKYFMMWSNGGEGQLPGGYLAIYELEEVADQQLPEMKGFFIFGLEGDHVFAFDTRSHQTTADYSVVEFSLGSRDLDEIETVARDFDGFLQRRMHAST